MHHKQIMDPTEAEINLRNELPEVIPFPQKSVEIDDVLKDIPLFPLFIYLKLLRGALNWL